MFMGTVFVQFISFVRIRFGFDSGIIVYRVFKIRLFSVIQFFDKYLIDRLLGIKLGIRILVIKGWSIVRSGYNVINEQFVLYSGGSIVFWNKKEDVINFVRLLGGGKRCLGGLLGRLDFRGQVEFYFDCRNGEELFWQQDSMSKGM